jgi:hypothetical protein
MISEMPNVDEASPRGAASLRQVILERVQINGRAAGAVPGTVGRDLGAKVHTEVDAALTPLAAGDAHPPRTALASGLALLTRIGAQRLDIYADGPWYLIGRQGADADTFEIERADELLGVAVGAEVG